MSHREAIIHVLDGVFSPELCQRAIAVVGKKRWYFGNSSAGGAEPGFWKMDLEGDAAPSRPYNLVATPRWLLVVPRRRAHFEGAPVNALAFAGALLAFDDLQLARIRTAGPLAVLAGTVLRNQETTPAGRVT